MILKNHDILDVWFDSGSTHAFVLEDRAISPARLIYIAQARSASWVVPFVIIAILATRSRAPYKAVLTHGFVLDEQGRKCQNHWAM